MIFGKKIKALREEQGLVQRQLASVIEVDTPMYSKIERGERKCKREHVKLIAQKLHADEKELLTIWLESISLFCTLICFIVKETLSDPLNDIILSVPILPSQVQAPDNIPSK